MNQRDVIQTLQNSNDMLNCQYSARFHFNLAESFGYWAFAASILSAFCIFLPESDNIFIIAIPIFIDVIALIIQWCAGKAHRIAAKLRNYFDAVVLGINEKDNSLEDVRFIKETIFKTISKHHAESIEQINNTGCDTPPGVKDWYDLSFNTDSTNAVFECQKQNFWWTEKLTRIRLLINTVILLILLISFIMATHFFEIPLSKVILCFFALTLNQGSNIVNNCKYLRLIHEMDTIKKIPDIENNPVQIIHYQQKINELRAIPIFEINAVHKYYSKKWTEMYSKIINK